MVKPDLVLDNEMRVIYYSYEEALLDIVPIVMEASLVGLISMIISLIIGIRGKDCFAIAVANLMVKTVAIFLFQTLYSFLYLDNIFMLFLLFLLATIIEGLIYNKVLKYKKHNGIVVSIICNIATVVTGILILFILGNL